MKPLTCGNKVFREFMFEEMGVLAERMLDEWSPALSCRYYKKVSRKFLHRVVRFFKTMGLFVDYPECLSEDDFRKGYRMLQNFPKFFPSLNLKKGFDITVSRVVDNYDPNTLFPENQDLGI